MGQPGKFPVFPKIIGFSWLIRKTNPRKFGQKRKSLAQTIKAKTKGRARAIRLGHVPDTKKKPERSRKGRTWNCNVQPEKHRNNVTSAPLSRHSWPSKHNLSGLRDRW
jgi:hypothetical protein